MLRKRWNSGVIDKGNLECRQTNSAVNGIKDLTGQFIFKIHILNPFIRALNIFSILTVYSTIILRIQAIRSITNI